MKHLLLILPFLFIGIHDHTYVSSGGRQVGLLKITFRNTIKGDPIELDSKVYKNPFGEEYSISKFKYYISNIALSFPDGIFSENESYHLVSETDPASQNFGIMLPAGSYQSLHFMLGVDSIRNVSGAQTGALDPLNDMFWTWNTGYIMAKMEGRSPQSNVVNHKVEYHIGGFWGESNVLKKLKLNLPSALAITEGRTSEIIIEADFDKWWQQPNDLKISEHPVCSSPGELAKKIADNYSKMFTIKQVTSN